MKYYNNGQEPTINYGKAVKYLEALLSGKNHKQSAHEAGLKKAQPALMKEMFPLFLGLKRPYNKGD